MSCEGTLSDESHWHPRSGRFGGSNQICHVDPSDGRPAPRIPQTSSFHTTRPFDSDQKTDILSFHFFFAS